MLLNTDIYDLFFVKITSDFANYTDDTTPHECDQHCDNLISNLELTVDKIFNWFVYNNLKVNASKGHISLSSHQHTSININASVIKRTNSEKLLGITIDSDFTFEEHINTNVEKLAKNCMRYLKFHNIKGILFETFIMSQFNYCPLV